MGVNYPFGSVATESIAADAVTSAITISEQETIITTAALSANLTINLTVLGEVAAGAKIHLKATTAGTETITFGTAIEAPVITGSAGKTVTQSFFYNGTNFYPCGAKIQVD